MSQNPRERFEEAWRDWAGRAPRTAAPLAGAQLRARLAEASTRSTAVNIQRGLLAAAAAVLLALGGWLVLRPVAPFPEATGSFGITAPQPLSPGVALIWLDAETPLYMTLTPAEAPVEDQGDSP